MNREKPGLYIIPEDSRNVEIANGFLKLVTSTNVHVEPSAEGWTYVVKQFKNEYVPLLRTYPDPYVILLVDFDGKSDRAAKIKQQIPEELKERVFVLGTKRRPEILNKNVAGIRYEGIGLKLAQECRDEDYELWNHAELEINREELNRMHPRLRPLLFY